MLIQSHKSCRKHIRSINTGKNKTLLLHILWTAGLNRTSKWWRSKKLKFYICHCFCLECILNTSMSWSISVNLSFPKKLSRPSKSTKTLLEPTTKCAIYCINSTSNASIPSYRLNFPLTYWKSLSLIILSSRSAKKSKKQWLMKCSSNQSSLTFRWCSMQWS